MNDYLKAVNDRFLRESEGKLLWAVKHAAQANTRLEERLPRVMEQLGVIDSAGLASETLLRQLSAGDFGWSRMSLEIVPSELPKWRKVGKLTAAGKRFERHEGGVDYIRVTVTVEGLSEFELEYVRELPEGSRCKVVNEASSYRTLVCSR